MSALFILIASFIPNFVWLALYLREDTDPEPPRLVVFAFFGGVCATGIALALEYAALKTSSAVFAAGVSQIYNSFWYMVLGVALIEECVKFFMTRILIMRNPEFDQPVDAMVYCIVVALGFAFAENVVVITNAMLPYHGAVFAITQTVILRFIGANFLHLLASGIVGYAWAQGILKRKQFAYIVGGIVAATVIHSAFNAIMLSLGQFAYVIAVSMMFGVAIWLLRDFEVLKQLSGKRIIEVAYAEPK